jgi:hypothetical protein
LRLLTIELYAEEADDVVQERLHMLHRGTLSLINTDGPESIDCPRCHWAPRQWDRWECECGHRWDTFATKGSCPRCHQPPRETECLCCGIVVPHASWYAKNRPN